MDALSLLSPAQAAVARRVVAEESSRRSHVVVSLSGAHAYGFPSPDSDLDIKAVHVEPTARLVGLSVPVRYADRLGVEDGVEIDYTSNEIGPVLAGVLSGNGNYIERVLGGWDLQASEELQSLRPVARGAISRRVYHHYAGFAAGLRRQFESSHGAKKALYVLRTALTGAHMLRTAEAVTDLNVLADRYRFPEVQPLIVAKRAGERAQLDEMDVARTLALLDRAQAELASALIESPLPPEPTPEALAAVEGWLVDLRRARFQRL